MKRGLECRASERRKNYLQKEVGLNQVPMSTRAYVEAHLIAFDPEGILPLLAPDIRALYNNRALVKLAPSTDFVVSHIAGLILAATESRIRFRKYECLRTVRHIVRGGAHEGDLSLETCDRLFRLYQHYIFAAREEVQWCVGSFISGRVLTGPQIQWLIERSTASVHLVNRLLKYPIENPLIRKWAEDQLLEDALPGRRSELLALLINEEDGLPSFAASMPIPDVLWAIYKARCSQASRSAWLCELAVAEHAEHLLKIAMRLRAPELVKRLSELMD